MKNILDCFYNRVIADLGGRVASGLLVLAALGVSVTSFDRAGEMLVRMNAWLWLSAFALAWLTSVALISLGRRFNLVHMTPDSLTDEQHSAAEEEFQTLATEAQQYAYEKLTAIRDAAAAGSVAIFLSLAILAVDFVVDVHMHESPWSEIQNGATAVVVCIALGVSLQLAHREYVRRACRYLSAVLDEAREARNRIAPTI